MNPPTSEPTRDEVLDAFAVEQSVGRETLERYLRKYPQFAADLVDLSRELSRVGVEDEAPLSAEDTSAIDAAWQRHVDAAPTVIADPFATLSLNELRDIATHLGVPRQVVTAFRERKVDVSSVPTSFLNNLASLVKMASDQFIAYLSGPPRVSYGQSYKADEKPNADVRVSFEQLLIDAGVSEGKRALLLARSD